MAKLDPGDGGGGGGGDGSTTEDLEDPPQDEELNVDTGGLTEDTTTTESSTTSQSTEGGGRDSSPDTNQSDTTEQDPTAEEPSTEAKKQSTDRANQSVSLGTTGLGTSGTNQSRKRDRTPRSNQSPSLSTTTLGTSGTEQSRKRQQTTRASQSQDFSASTIGTTQGKSNRSTGGSEDTEELTDIDYSEGFDEFEEHTTGINLPFGGDEDVDEVERFVDEQIGERGSEFVSQNISPTLEEIGKPRTEPGGSALGSFAAPFQLSQQAVRGQELQVGTSANPFALASANIAEDAPRVPAVALEGVEGANFLLEATPAAGGSEKLFDKRAGLAADFAVDVAEAEAERAKNNPETFATEALIGLGAGQAVGATRFVPSGSKLADSSAARRAATQVTPDSSSARNLASKSSTLDLRTPVTKVESRTPDVSVTRDPDAGLVDIDPQLKQQLTQKTSIDLTTPDVSLPSVRPRSRLAAARAGADLDTFANRARFTASQGAAQARNVVVEGAQSAQEAATSAATRVRTAPSIAARNVAQEASRVRRRASSAKAAAEFEVSRGMETLSEPRERFTTPGFSDLRSAVSLPDSDFALNEAARSAGRRFELRKRQAQLNLAAADASTRETVGALAEGIPRRRDISDAAFRARFKANEAITDARVGGELALRSAAAPDIDTPSVGRPIQNARDAAFRAKERTSAALTSARVGAELSLRTAELPNTPNFSAGVPDIDSPTLKNPLRGAPDLTIRVNAPSSRRADADEFVAEGFDVDEVFDDADTDVDSPIEVDGDSDSTDTSPIDSGGGVSGGGNAPLSVVDDSGPGSGTQQRALTVQVAADPDSRPDVPDPTSSRSVTGAGLGAGLFSIKAGEGVANVEMPSTFDVPSTSTETTTPDIAESPEEPTLSPASRGVSNTQTPGVTAEDEGVQTSQDVDDVVSVTPGTTVSEDAGIETATTPDTEVGPVNIPGEELGPVTETPPKTGQPVDLDTPAATRTLPPRKPDSPGRRPTPSIALDGDTDKKRRRPDEPESFEKTFESEVASSEEVLGGDDGSSSDLSEGL